MARPAPSAGLRRDLDLLEQLTGEEALRRGGLGVARLAELTGWQKSQVSGPCRP
jgi:IclR family transcriptional regulator, KDG regulon repressor